MNKQTFLLCLSTIFLINIIHLFSIQVIVASNPPKPSDQGSSEGREGAATRGSCEKTSLAFTPVLPPPTNEGFTGLTLKEHPTFWFYIPYKTDSVSSGKFVIREEDGGIIYRSEFSLPKTPGFVSINLPITAKALEKNKSYAWKLVLNCASQDSAQPDKVSHEGLIQRVDNPTLESQLQSANLTQRVKLYVDNNILYDAASDLERVREFPDAWLTLLKAMKLQDFKQEVMAGQVIKTEK